MSEPGNPDQLNFDTADYPPEKAFDRYRAFYGLGARVEQTGPAVAARIEAWRLERMVMYHRRLNDVAHERDVAQRDRNGFDHFTATLVLGGELIVEDHDGTRLAPAVGEVLFLDVVVPNRNLMRGARVVTLSIARDQMAAIAGNLDGLHGLILAAGQARLFRDFVESLILNLPGMNPVETAAASGILATLLMIAIDRSGFDRSGAASARDEQRLTQFRRLVDARLSDPEFDAATAIREAGLSRATLYRLLRQHGGLVTFLRDRRLERVRTLLSDSGEVRPLAEVVAAAGLQNVSHASRGFLDRYAVRPARYRELVKAGSGDDAFYKLRFWQNELR